VTLPRPIDDEAQSRAFLIALGLAAQLDPQRDLRELFSAVAAQLDVSRRVRIHVLDRWFEADQILAPIVPALDDWIRLSEAAELAAEALAGKPEIHDQASIIDDIWSVRRVRGQARGAILRQPLLSSSAVAQALGASPSNREIARTLRDKGDIIGLEVGRAFAYPAFQFDHDGRRVWPAVKLINQALDARHDPWGVAGWWLTRDRVLGAAPWELVSDPQREPDVVRAAEAVTEPLG
jgi:hypothetical protein